MKSFQPKVYEFGKFSLDASERVLSDAGLTVPLPPKVFDTLLFLVENSGHILSKQRMLGEIWEDSFVEENNLAQNISVLRRILGKSSNSKFIETVPKFGYRFIAPVRASLPANTDVFEHSRARVYLSDEEYSTAFTALASPPLLTFAPPETRYVQNGDVNIAYQVIGEWRIGYRFRDGLGLASRIFLEASVLRVVPESAGIVFAPDPFRQTRHGPVGPRAAV